MDQTTTRAGGVIVALTVLIPLVVAFELLWRRNPMLRPHRTQFRILLGVFFLLTIAIHGASRFEWLPQDVRFGRTGALRFAADSLDYQNQAGQVAVAVKRGEIGELFNREYFGYSRLIGLLYAGYGIRPLAAMLLNSVFYMTSVLCVFVMMRTLFDGRTASLATWIVGLWPSFLLHETQLLRWTATTAGLHLSIAAIVLICQGANVGTAAVMAAIGYFLLLVDLPYIAQLLYVTMLAHTVVMALASLNGWRYFARALICGCLAVLFLFAYQSARPPSPGDEIYTWERPVPAPLRVPRFTPGWVVTFGERTRASIQGRIDRILDLRDRSIADARGSATAFHGLRPLRTKTDFVRNLPSAYRAAFLAPSPGQLLNDLPGMSNMRRFVILEMLVYYALLPLMFVGFAAAIRRSPGESRLALGFLGFFILAVYGLLGTIVMNAGTLYRLRLPYILVQFGFAVVGGRAIASWLRPAPAAPMRPPDARERPVVLLSIPNTLSTRNLLRTDVLPLLKARAERVVLVTPFVDDAEFRAEFVRDNVVAYRMAPYAPTRLERALTSFIYNVYLAGSSPESLQLFFGRWTERHPRLAPWRRLVNRVVLRPLNGIMPALERAFTSVGDAGGYAKIIATERPDLAAFSRLFFCDEIPLMRAIARAEVPSIGLVASWDNLTSKGPLIPRVDRLAVWNHRMQAEAVRFHRYAAADVDIVGAPHHDLLFRERHRLQSREEVFASAGLDPSRRLIVFGGEDPAIAPDTLQYVELLHRFIENNQLVAPCQILVRPHPQDDPVRLDRVRTLSHVRLELPGRPIERYWMDMTRGDLWHLYEILAAADVVVNVTSTIVVDAAMVDTPSICIGFAYSLPPTHFQSPMRYFDMNHYRYAVESGATTIAESESALLAAVNRCLTDRGAQAEGRERLTRMIAEFTDGRSGERMATAIMATAARRGHRAAAGAHSRAGAAAPVSATSADVA